MNNELIYVDHAATTDIRPEVVDAMVDAMQTANANASGLHSRARAAKNAMEEAREEAAAILGADRPLSIIFTSGGTESDNLGVAGALTASGRTGVVTSAVEHEAVLETAASMAGRGFEHRVVGVDSAGRVDPDRVAAAVDTSVGVVSVMAANNEIGTVQPVAEVAEAVRTVDSKVQIHTDAVQAFASEAVTFDALGVDSLSLAAHKFGGPKGVGILAVRNGVSVDPVQFGGGQEAGRRSGTYNVPGIVGMVRAMRLAAADRSSFAVRVAAERDAFESRLKAPLPDIVVNGADTHRLPQHSHVRIPGVSAETVLIRLDQAGVAAAAGSACQSGAVEPSHVLKAMGYSDEAAGECVRITFGWTSRPGDGVATADRLIAVLEDLQ